MSRNFFTCLGNKALATLTAFFTFLSPKAFLARLAISCLITCSAFRLTPRVKPALNLLRVLLGTYKGFRVQLRKYLFFKGTMNLVETYTIPHAEVWLGMFFFQPFSVEPFHTASSLSHVTSLGGIPILR